MTERERLIELLKKAPLCNRDFDLQYSDGTIEKIADYLLANGVIVPSCKVGDEINGEVVHEISYIESLEVNGTIKRWKYVHTCGKELIGKVVFASHPITWEEAEQALTCRKSRQDEKRGAE